MLPLHYPRSWWQRRDLNPYRLGYEPRALPIKLRCDARSEWESNPRCRFCRPMPSTTWLSDRVLSVLNCQLSVCDSLFTVYWVTEIVPTGFEPAIFCLRGRRLEPIRLRDWRCCWKTAKARLTGFEPATSCSTDRHSHR
jgi:hypothetical protein